MTHMEYIELFHRAQVNLVAFKPVFHCDAELKAMVELAIKEEREACAKICDEWANGMSSEPEMVEMAKEIRARGEA